MCFFVQFRRGSLEFKAIDLLGRLWLLLVVAAYLDAADYHLSLPPTEHHYKLLSKPKTYPVVISNTEVNSYNYPLSTQLN